ncbi:hypothetical protein FRB96_004883 [Tulasnella sp. 330]|nr:hypothetical protein FRB96_004883 [Tulasnella sp. 330]
MECLASPGSMSDTGLDALDEDTGIFVGSPKPQEQYFQRRLTRSSKLLAPMQVITLGEPSRVVALDLTNETEVSHNSTEQRTETTEALQAQSEHESNGPSARVPPLSDDIHDALSLTPGQPPLSELPSCSAETAMPLPDETRDLDSTRTSLLSFQQPPTSPERTISPTRTRRCTPNLISFESIPVTRLSSPNGRPLSPVSSRIDLLEATPEAHINLPTTSEPLSTSPIVPTLIPLPSLIFTPQTTASFTIQPEPQPQSQERPNVVPLTTNEAGSPATGRFSHSTPPRHGRSPDNLSSHRSAKRPKLSAEAPTAFANRDPKTHSTINKRLSSLPRCTPGASSSRPSVSCALPAALRTLRSVSPTSDAILDSISVVCGPTRVQVYSTLEAKAQRGVESCGSVAPSDSVDVQHAGGQASSTPHQQQPLTLEELVPVRAAPPPTAFRIPPNFHFNASSNTPPIRSTAKQVEVRTPRKAVLPNPKVKATPAGETSPLKPIVFGFSLMQRMSPKRLAASTSTSKPEERKALAASVLGSPSRNGFPIPPPSPRKAQASGPWTPRTVDRRLVLGTPVRPGTHPQAESSAHVMKPPRLNLVSAYSNKQNAKPPKINHPAMVVPTPAAHLPLGDLNLNKEVAPVAQSDVLAKPSALPLPKAFRSSRLPQIGGVGGRNRTGPVTTVNMVHIPHVGIAGSPIEPPRKLSPQPPRPKRFRAVIPGTLTGWEGKPAAEQQAEAGPSSGSGNGSDEALTNDGSDTPHGIDDHRVGTANGHTTTETHGHCSRTRSHPAGGKSSKSPSPEASSPRRSRRLSKEKENEADGSDAAMPNAEQAGAPRVIALVRATDARTTTSAATAGRSKSKASTIRPTGATKRGRMSDTGITEISARELQALTTRNTTHNQRYFISLDRRVIHKDCPRPPSPSSKVRAAIPEEQLDKESARLGRLERAKRRGLLEDEMGTEDDESSTGKTSTKHVRGAGDDEDYETPKRRKLDGDGTYVEGEDCNVKPFAALSIARPAIEKQSTRTDLGEKGDDDDLDRLVKPNSGGRFVRWHKKLVFDCEQGETIKVAGHGNGGILAKDAGALGLDKRGNVPEANKCPDGLEKEVIVVTKYVYADDSDHEDPQPPVRRTKRKRAGTAEA